MFIFRSKIVLNKVRSNAVWAENGKKNWSGQARTKILYFASCWIGVGPKFCFLFRAEPGPGQNFYVYFGVGRVGPIEKSGLRRSLAGVTLTTVFLLS